MQPLIHSSSSPLFTMLAVSPHQNIRGFNSCLISWWPQCLLRILAGLSTQSIWWNDKSSDFVVWQSHVTLLQFRMWNCRTSYHNSVVSKHVTPASDRKTQIPTCQSEVNNKLSEDPCNNKLRTICCCLHSVLLLGEPDNRSLVHEI